MSAAEEESETVKPEELFDKVGDSYLSPTFYSECIWPISIEDLYQAFKIRMQREAQEENPKRDFSPR